MILAINYPTHSSLVDFIEDLIGRTLLKLIGIHSFDEDRTLSLLLPAVHSKSDNLRFLQYFFRPVEKDSNLKKRLEAEAEMWDSMLKKRLEAEAEMWDLWRMGEEEEAVSSEDTDFACRCVKKAKN
jgi:hypothetical protein